MGELWRRISYLVNHRRLEAELEADMEFHREMAARAGRNNFGKIFSACASNPAKPGDGHGSAASSRTCATESASSPALPDSP